MLKYISHIVFFALMLPSLNAQSDTGLQRADTMRLSNDSGKSYVVHINQLIKTAEKQLGTPYCYAGKKPGGFDCSGFVMYCYNNALGVKLPPMATTYYQHGIPVTKEMARPGDVICFTGSNAYNRSIGHVGIITEVTPTEIYFIHSALNGGIRYDALSQAYYKQRFLQIRRILY
jgi:cell wall-associated NlpC family hydrolase